jgi:hypothetical protein
MSIRHSTGNNLPGEDADSSHRILNARSCCEDDRPNHSEAMRTGRLHSDHRRGEPCLSPILGMKPSVYQISLFSREFCSLASTHVFITLGSDLPLTLAPHTRLLRVWPPEDQGAECWGPAYCVSRYGWLPRSSQCPPPKGPANSKAPGSARSESASACWDRDIGDDQ